MNPISLPDSYKYLAAFLTMRCNLDCSYCLNRFSKTNFNRSDFDEISGGEWVDSLNRIEAKPGVPVTLSGGEPFLHKNFIEIVNGLKPELDIDILTNLYWGRGGIDEFISRVNPSRLKRDSPYPAIRVSYHPEQMKEGDVLLNNVKRLKDAGFNIGIYAVQHPGSEQLQSITQMQFKCADEGILFRLKDFTGVFEGTDDQNRPFSLIYGDYSKYPQSAFQKETRDCLCKTTEMLIGPNADVYRCHRDVYSAENPIGNILDPEFQVRDTFRSCDKYGRCHPCDVKVKTDNKQQRGHTSVEIKDLK